MSSSPDGSGTVAAAGRERRQARVARLSRARSWAGAVAVAATVPYLLLKTDWVLGGHLGMTDPVRLGSPLYRAANAATFAADLAAVVLALALTRGWGRRLHPVLVLAPLWCATGLLGTILLLLPLAVGSVLAAPQPQAAGLATWVYAVVYGGFAVQGVALLTAGSLYAVDRWPRRLQTLLPPGAVRATRRAVVVPTVALALAAGLQVAWACGLAAGVEAPSARWTLVDRAALLVRGLSAGLAALSALRLTSDRAVPAGWPATVGVWLGTSATVTWGGYVVAYTTVVDPPVTSAAATLVGLASVVTALLLVAVLGRAVHRGGKAASVRP